jgi:hypothetical protein
MISLSSKLILATFIAAALALLVQVPFSLAEQPGPDRVACLRTGKVECIGLENPLVTNETEISVIVGNILKAALSVIGSLTILMLVWGGFLWLTSHGNAEKVKKGTQTIVWAVVGVVAVFASYLLLSNFIDYLTGGGPETGFTADQSTTGGEAGTEGEGCACSVTISGRFCNVNLRKVFPYDQQVTVQDLVNEVSAEDCPAKVAASAIIDTNNKAIDVSKAQCEAANNFGGTEQGYTYSISCSTQ